MNKNFTFETKIYDGFGDATNDLYGMVSDHKPIILTITKKEQGKTTDVEKVEEQVEEKVDEKVAIKKTGPKTKRKSKRKRTGTT